MTDFVHRNAEYIKKIGHVQYSLQMYHVLTQLPCTSVDFHDLYISSDEKLFNKILTCPNQLKPYPTDTLATTYILHKIAVLEIDLTIDSYLTAFLE